jgi:non-specific serine/threonine protein kinase/serine/threonine-protein kinase
LSDERRAEETEAPETEVTEPTVTEDLREARTVVLGEAPSKPGQAPREVVIGPYRLLRKLGEGGMGQVWLARQSEPVKRKVAFKVIKHGMDTRQVVTRFEAERQALAMMDHPSIAKVLDAGTTPRGQPFFVMEYVQGVPIDEHCDEQQLGTRERLRLLQQACAGVHHAHQRGIIHRDLKPSNLLASVVDGETLPKVIDFGIAKALEEKLTDETMQTAMGAVIGTPEYMSPEQVTGVSQDVDTRTDVYALGVILYRLLTGKLPFGSEKLRGSGFDEMRRMIREDEPLRPSAQLGRLDAAETETFERLHGESPKTLQHKLAGDLDWITMKAMDKDRARRYDSPLELSADIQRYLDFEPVVARPPSVGYRARKFARRHRFAVALGAAVGLALIVGGIGTGVGFMRAKDETHKAMTVTEYLITMLSEANPEKAQGRDVTVREALDSAARTVSDSFVGEPELEAQVRATMGLLYHEMGYFDDAEPQWRRAIELYEETLGPRKETTLNTRARLARTLMDSGRHADAEEEFRYLFPIFVAKRGGDDFDTLSLQQNLAAAYLHQKKHAEAEPVLLDLVERRLRLLGEDHPRYLASANNLAHLYLETDRLEEAEPLLVTTLDARRRTLGERHPRTLVSTYNLGDLRRRRDRFDEAEPLIREALDGFREVLDESHPYALEALNGYVATLIGLERFDEAEERAVESLRLCEARHGSDHARTKRAGELLAEIRQRTGN